MRAGSGQSFAINGFDMYVETRGEGEPLLLLHGGGGVGANWDLIFPECLAGYRLIVPDQRGHGRSTTPPGGFTFRNAGVDALALLDGLGIDACKAIGLSMGAKALLHAATIDPKRLEAMVLVSATPYFPPEARAVMAALTPENRNDAEWTQMRAWHTHGDEQIRAIWTEMHALKDSYDDMNFTADRLSTITGRTLIVHGDRDPLYPVRLALDLYTAIPHAHLWVVPNAGHGPIFGSMADRFRETSLAFLSGAWEER